MRLGEMVELSNLGSVFADLRGGSLFDLDYQVLTESDCGTGVRTMSPSFMHGTPDFVP